MATDHDAVCVEHALTHPEILFGEHELILVAQRVFGGVRAMAHGADKVRAVSDEIGAGVRLLNVAPDDLRAVQVLVQLRVIDGAHLQRVETRISAGHDEPVHEAHLVHFHFQRVVLHVGEGVQASAVHNVRVAVVVVGGEDNGVARRRETLVRQRLQAAVDVLVDARVGHAGGAVVSHLIVVVKVAAEPREKALQRGRGGRRRCGAADARASLWRRSDARAPARAR